MKIEGNWDTRTIRLNGKLLSSLQSREVRNHSPNGFNWGYAGSGPAQLALAILLTRTDKETALHIYQGFKSSVIAWLPEGNFSRAIDVDEYIINRGGQIIPSESGFGSDTITQMQANCGPFSDRCYYARNDNCNCNCGGRNHGKAKLT